MCTLYGTRLLDVDDFGRLSGSIQSSQDVFAGSNRGKLGRILACDAGGYRLWLNELYASYHGRHTTYLDQLVVVDAKK